MANWLSRFTGAPPPRRKRDAGGHFTPVPMALQTALPSDLTVIDTSRFGFTLGSVNEGRPPHLMDNRRDVRARVGGILQRILGKIGVHSQTLTNFRADVGVNEFTVLPYNPARCYLLIVNTGANEVRLGFDRNADVATGLPLPAGGGFFEPILGTISSVHAVSAVANQNIIVVEGFYSAAGTAAPAEEISDRERAALRELEGA